VVQKVALQINCKLGGELWGCRSPVKNIMVVGLDSFHDPAAKDKSVYGFVASMNETFSSWLSLPVRQSDAHMELGDKLRVCMEQALIQYNAKNAEFPQFIVVFRDGLGDSQIEVRWAKYLGASLREVLFRRLPSTKWSK